MRVYADSSLDIPVDNIASKTASTLASSGVPSGQNLLDDGTSDKSPVKSAGLTLEQKRQLAAEQTQRSRLQQAQNSLTPLPQTLKSNPVAAPPSKPVPLDLTSTLINSNLNAMSQLPALKFDREPIGAVSWPQIRMNELRLPINQQQCGTPYQNGTNFVQPNSFGNWNMATTVGGGPVNSLRSTQPSHVILPSSSLLGTVFSSQNDGTLSSSSPSSVAPFKPLSQSEIDDLLR